MKTINGDIEHALASLFEEIDRLKSEVSRLTRLVEKKDAEIADLKGRLSKYERPPKGSGNSSVPPTKDCMAKQAIRHTSSLRKPTGRKSGGQPGHEGHTLCRDMETDETVAHTPVVCECCGKPLDPSSAREVSSHYTVDFRVVRHVTRHVSYECRCQCGHTTHACLPEGMRHGVNYGPMTEALAAYLLHGQCVPMARVRQILADVFGLAPSEGTIQNMVKSIGKRAEFPYEVIRQKIENAHAVGADETGAAVQSENSWAWVFQNEGGTYVFFDRSRGIKAVEKHFPQHFSDSIIVSDRHSTYSTMETGGRQVCLAHLLRNLEYLNQLDEGQSWSRDFQQLLREAIKTRPSCREPLPDAHVAEKFRQRAEKLIDIDLSMLDGEFEKLRHGIAKVKDYLFTFLRVNDVPPDNNASERAVRIIKVKQKVSGCFRTVLGADNYARLHSIMDTAHKNGQSKYHALLALAMT